MWVSCANFRARVDLPPPAFPKTATFLTLRAHRAHQVQEQEVRHPGRILQVGPCTERLIRGARLLEGPQLKSCGENPPEPIFERGVDCRCRELAPPASPRVLERAALEVAIDAQAPLRAAAVALPDPKRSIGAGMGDRGDQSPPGP